MLPAGEQDTPRQHHDGAIPEAAGLVDRILWTEPSLPLTIQRKVDQLQRVSRRAMASREALFAPAI